MNDEELERRLKQWQPEMPDSSAFRREVWSRIEDEPSRVGLAAFVRAFFNWLNRPVVGIPVAVVVMAFAIWLAVANGRSSSNEVMYRMATSYHNAINPINHHLR